MIAIDKNIPMPERAPGNAGNGSGSKYPWLQMEVGDSFLHPEKQSNASAQAHAVWKKHGLRFKTAKVDGGTRIWRVA